jgi:hypothetical protein
LGISSGNIGQFFREHWAFLRGTLGIGPCTEKQQRWEKCAVVGSGGDLWQSGLGSKIDAHDVVLRVNQVLQSSPVCLIWVLEYGRMFPEYSLDIP